jgi:DNA modification methylase
VNKIFLESCIDTLNKNIEYDYIFFSPPDYDELNYNPKKDKLRYMGFLRELFHKLDSDKVITIVVSDRKFNSGIIPKHSIIINIMNDLGYKYVSQKIWCKSFKYNMYRLNYAFIMTFSKSKCKQKYTNEYRIDVWNYKQKSYKGYTYNMPVKVAQICIENLKNKNDIVYDPFMGVGTTAIASLNSNRKFLGSEIDETTYNLAKERIKNYSGGEQWF